MIPIFSLFKDRKEKKEEGYIEVISMQKPEEAKIYVRVFVLRDFSDVKAVVDTLREGNTIVFVDIRYLRENKDITEFKRAINRIKSVVEAIGGDIVAVGNEWIIATPSFARIYRKKTEEEKI